MEQRNESKGLAALDNEDTVQCSVENQGNLFQGVRFFLAGFDPSAEIQYATEIQNNGGFNVGRYDASCTHVIVHGLTYDDPICAAAKKDKKTLVTDLWVVDALDTGMLVDSSKILYKPVRDLNGIPGSKSLCICLTGYQSQDRSNIMRMVDMMGARFTKPLIAKVVTHLICYKFEGDKYKLAKQMGLKLVSHRWLEDCLKAWVLLPEENYQKSGWELELLEAEARDSEDEGASKFGSPMPSKQIISSVNHVGSTHKPLGISSTTPSHVHDNMKLHTPKSVTKASPEAGLQSRGTHSSTKCDLGSLLKNKGEANTVSDVKTKGMQLEKVGNEEQEMEGIRSPALGKERDVIGGMASVEKEILTSAVHSSSIVGNGKKTPRKSGTGNTIETGRFETPVGSAQGFNLMYEKDEFGNSPLSNNISYEQAQAQSENVRKNIQSRAKEAIERDVRTTLFDNDIEVVQQSDNGLSVHTGGQFRTHSESVKTQTLEGGLLDSNSGFKKVTRSDVIADLPNISRKLDETFDDGKLGMHAEGSSSKRTLSSASKLRTANDETPETVNPASGFIENACDDIPGNELQTSGIETKNRDCQLELPASGKRKRQTKSYGPNKRKNTMSGNRLTSLNKALPSKSGEDSHGEEIPKVELSAEKGSLDNGVGEIKGKLDSDFKTPEKENLDNGVVEIKRKLDNDLKTPERENLESVVVESEKKLDNDLKTSEKEKLDNGVAEIETKLEHGSKTPSQLHSLTSKNSNCITSQSLPANDNSVLPQKKGRKPAINKKAGVKKSYGSKTKTATSKEEVRPFDLNVSNGIETCDPQVELTADKRHEPFSDLTSEAAQLKPDALDDNQQHFSEQGNIAAKGFVSNEETVSLSTLVEKHHDIASTEKPRKRGRPGIKKRKASELDKLDPAIEETKGCDDMASSVAKAKPVDNHMVSMPGAVVSQNGSPNAPYKEKSDISPSPRLNSSPFESSAKPGHSNENVHQHSCALSPDSRLGLKDLEIDQISQVSKDSEVSKDCQKKQPVENKDAEHIELKTPQGEMDETVETNERNSDEKNQASIPKKAKSSARTTYTPETKASSVTKKSLECMNDGKENVSNLNRTSKVQSGKLAKIKKPTKTAKKPRKVSQSIALQNIKDVGQPNKHESSKLVMSAEPRWFLLSGHRLQRKEFQQLVKSLGGKVLKDSHQWSYQATHLVVPEPLRRTEKFFAAAAAGRWILTTDYLTASKQAGRFLDEQEYEWHKSGLNEDGTISFEAPRKWRLLQEKTGHGALHGFRIIVYGECIAPSLDTLKRVVKAGGGVILATSPPYNRSLVLGVDFAVVSPGIPRDDTWVQEFIRCDVACVLVDYLVEYVCKPCYPLDKYVLYSTHAAVEKFFKNKEMKTHPASASNVPQQTLLGEISRNNVEEEERKRDDISCSVCGSNDRDDVMLLCGDEQGRGCGTAMHIDCCQPPLAKVPEEDWFCLKCQPPADLHESSNAKKVKKS